MSFTLTSTATDKTQANKKEPALILEIDGHDRIYSNISPASVLKIIRVGDPLLYVDGSWSIGDLGARTDVDDYISFDGTSTSISQQLQQDKGGASSVTSMQISLSDIHGDITDLISPVTGVSDILGREAFVYLGFKDTQYPQDYIPLFIGLIDEVSSGMGNIVLNISNAEQKKRQDIFPVIETSLNGAITNAQTTITLTDVTSLNLPVASILETYVKINNEIVRYTGIDTVNKQITGCTRAQFGTIAAAGANADSVSQFLRLMGTATDLALQLMLSDPDNVYYKTGIDVTNFVTDSLGATTTNSLFFVGVDVKTKYGVVVGDFITTTGASTGANNFTLRTVTSVTVDTEGSKIVVNGAALVSELATAAVMSIKSQYNVLPDGAALGGHQVDVEEFKRIYSLFTTSIPSYDFYITETIKSKEFIDKDIMFPANLFTLPKKGRISLGVVSPPLSVGTLAVLDSSTITNLASIKIKRSIGKYFYNTVIYKYNYDAVDTAKPLTGYIKVDADSRNQIHIGTRAITISSKGMRNNATNSSIVSVNSSRLLEKYKYAAEFIQVSGFFGTLFNSDVGDIVLFGDLNLPLSDSTRGVRGFKPRLCEIIDKKMDIKTGKVDVTLLDTNYLVDGRYGIISPSSTIGFGSTATSLVITDSFSTVFPDIERNKWNDYIGENLFIHNDNWSTSYSATLLGFSDNYTMTISNIGIALPSGYIVDIANYPATTLSSDNRNLKNKFVFTDPSVAVVTGVSSTSFTVSAPNVAKFVLNNQIMLHDLTWSVKSPDVRVTDITGTTITVDAALGFIPSSSHTVELIGFIDGGSSYRYL